MSLTNLTAKTIVSLNAAITKALDLSTPKQIIDVLKEVRFTFGEADVNLINQVFHDRRLLALSTEDVLDLTDGTLKNPFGEDVDFDIIRVIGIFNRSDIVSTSPVHAVTDAEIYFGKANATFLGPLGVTGIPTDAPYISLEAGTGMLFVAPSATGWPVTETTGDDLVIGNADGVDQAMYDIVLLGEVTTP